MIAILGSGFGLYGYLPALIGGCGERVTLPEQYRARFDKRPELSRFAGSVQWERDEVAALDSADGVVLALPPIKQADWIPRCLARPHLKRLLLEKPLASSPTVAIALCSELAGSDKLVRMGYTFRFTPWGKQLQSNVGAFSITWTFLAHHFRHDLLNWKRTTVTGGGAIRFYGIQLIALLAEIGYRKVLSSRSMGESENEIEKWMATFTGPELPECRVALDTRAEVDRFRMELPDQRIADQSDPFTEAGDLDRRVPGLTSLCRTLCQPDAGEAVWYRATLELWQQVEEKTQFEITP